MKAKNVKDCFASHQEVNEFHATADGQVFFTDNDAYNNTSRLDDKKITVITRAEADELADDDEINVSTIVVIDDGAGDFTQKAPKTKTVQHEVTAEDIDKNPDLEESGIKVGDLIDVEVEDTDDAASTDGGDANDAAGTAAPGDTQASAPAPKKAAAKKAVAPKKSATTK